MSKKLSFLVPPKLVPFMEKSKRYKIAFGGRGGAKSQTFAAMQSYAVAQMKAKVLCMREFISSIADSSYALIKSQIKEIGIPGFDIQKTEINHRNGGCFRFKGIARSKEAIKSMYGFNIFSIEEGQFLSEESIRMIKPTLREAGSEIWIALNLQSQEDAISKEFINPYWDTLLKQGFYEDDQHYIVMINYCDNAKFPAVLETERQADKKKLSRALYDHIWLGHFNDSVESGLIQREWFDACIDAHKKLGFEPRGIKFVSHDPSDVGPDAKGYALRHGSVVLDVQERTTGDINEGGDWALSLALQAGIDAFIWDCDGMGVGLNRQISRAFDGKKVQAIQFKGSEGVDYPDAIFNPADKASIAQPKKNKDALKNKRAQYYFKLRNRIYKTYEAVEKQVYHDPDTLISFDSTMSALTKLRSELCKMPVKPNVNGLFELYTKKEMKDKFKYASPNLADSVMMLMKTPPQPTASRLNLPPAPLVMDFSRHGRI